MKLNTTSAVISFAKQLENESAKFYEDWSEKYAKDKEFFLSFAIENKKNVVYIERAYYGVITDAIEGCFAFDIDTDKYPCETCLVQNSSYTDALREAIRMEEQIIKFYYDASEQSKSLMADVPVAFLTVAAKRNKRIPRLRSVLEKEV